jgi:hypothetical protein
LTVTPLFFDQVQKIFLLKWLTKKALQSSTDKEDFWSSIEKHFLQTWRTSTYTNEKCFIESLLLWYIFFKRTIRE